MFCILGELPYDDDFHVPVCTSCMYEQLFVALVVDLSMGQTSFKPGVESSKTLLVRALP